MHAVGQRLDERADARGHAVGQDAHVGRGRATRSANAPGRWMPMSVRRGHRFSWPARHSRHSPQPAERVDGDPRAVPRARAVAGRDDHAGELVAHDQRRRAVAHVAEVALDLRAADPDRLGAHDQLVRRRDRAARSAPRSSSVPARATRSPAWRHLLTSAAGHVPRWRTWPSSSTWRSPRSTATSPTRRVASTGAMPDEEVHAFVNDLDRPVGTHLYGRRLYEVLVAWETMDTGPDQDPVIRDFAADLAGGRQGRLLADARVGREREDADRARVRPRGGPADEGRGASATSPSAGPSSPARRIRAGLVDECHLLALARSSWAAASARSPTTSAGSSSCSTSAASPTASSTCITARPSSCPTAGPTRGAAWP